MPDYTLYSRVHVCWSKHSDSSFVYGFMSFDYGLGTMAATTIEVTPNKVNIKSYKTRTRCMFNNGARRACGCSLSERESINFLRNEFYCSILFKMKGPKMYFFNIYVQNNQWKLKKVKIKY